MRRIIFFGIIFLPFITLSMERPENQKKAKKPRIEIKEEPTKELSEHLCSPFDLTFSNASSKPIGVEIKSKFTNQGYIFPLENGVLKIVSVENSFRQLYLYRINEDDEDTDPDLIPSWFVEGKGCPVAEIPKVISRCVEVKSGSKVVPYALELSILENLRIKVCKTDLPDAMSVLLKKSITDLQDDKTDS